MSQRSLVSIIVPSFNEEADISGCLDAIEAQSYPRERMELIVVDGASHDRTVEVVSERLPSLGLHKAQVLNNPARRTSTSLNLGLAGAQGDIVVRLDARSRVQPHYIETIVNVLGTRSDVGVVGGAQVATPRSSSIVDRGVARALGNRWATGFSRYRRAVPSGPSDTVWMGAFRTAELRSLGGWNAAVALNEDFDLNERYRKSGAVVWYDCTLRSGYCPRRSLLQLARQYFRFGRVKGMWWARGRRPNVRQCALLVIPIGAAAGAVMAGQRWGWRTVALVGGGGAIAVDHFGAAHRVDPLGVRTTSIAAMGTISAMWWLGAIVGFVGENVGVEHQHG